MKRKCGDKRHLLEKKDFHIGESMYISWPSDDVHTLIDIYRPLFIYT
jgi:hypothetical protein